MTDTTTIEITTTQRKDLEQRKQDGNYDSVKGVLADLLENGETKQAGIDETTAREIAQDTVTDMVSYKALE